MSVNLAKTEVLQQIDLRKIKVDLLKKSKGLGNQKAEVVGVIDYSGSMQTLYRNGTVQATAERLLPMGLSFDDNGSLDMYAFHHGVLPIKAPCTLNNVFGYVNDNFKGDMGTTNYAPVINEIVKKFGNPKKSGGFFAKTTFEPREIPVLVIFITDGENGDKADTRKALIEASKHGIFFQFIGIGSERFQFLRELDDMDGRYIDNADFFTLNDLNRISDDELYERLMTELPAWCSEARSKRLIK